MHLVLEKSCQSASVNSNHEVPLMVCLSCAGTIHFHAALRTSGKIMNVAPQNGNILPPFAGLIRFQHCSTARPGPVHSLAPSPHTTTLALHIPPFCPRPRSLQRHQPEQFVAPTHSRNYGFDLFSCSPFSQYTDPAALGSRIPCATRPV